MSENTLFRSILAVAGTFALIGGGILYAKGQENSPFPTRLDGKREVPIRFGSQVTLDHDQLFTCAYIEEANDFICAPYDTGKPEEGKSLDLSHPAQEEIVL